MPIVSLQSLEGTSHICVEFLEGSGQSQVALHVWQTAYSEASSNVAHNCILNLFKEGVEVRGYASHLVGRQEFCLQSEDGVMDFVFEELNAKLSGSAKRQQISNRVLDEFAQRIETSITTGNMHPVKNIVQC